MRGNKLIAGWEGDYPFPEEAWKVAGEKFSTPRVAEESIPYLFSFTNLGIVPPVPAVNPVLLDPKNMSSANNGTDPNIIVSYQSGSAYNFAAFLQRLNNGLIMWVDMIGFSCADSTQIKQPITLTYDDIDGTGHYFTLYPKISENAKQNTVINFPCGFFLKSDMKLQVASMAATTLSLYLFSSRVTDQIAAFIGKNGIRYFKPPTIGEPKEVVFS